MKSSIDVLIFFLFVSLLSLLSINYLVRIIYRLMLFFFFYFSRGFSSRWKCARKILCSVLKKPRRVIITFVTTYGGQKGGEKKR